MRFLLIGLAIATLVGSARADEPKAQPPAPAPSKGAYVVVVGVSDTADKTIQPRPSADADAKALFDILSDKKYLDVAPDRVKLLTSTADDKRKGAVATHEAIVKAVHDAIANSGKDDLVVLAFFGRGASAGDRTCLFASDTTFKERAKTGVLGSDLETDLKAIKGQKLLLLMDVSWKGFDAGKEQVAEPTLKEITSALFGGDDQLDKPFTRDRAFLMATLIGSDPLEKDGRGVFAAAVEAGLKGAADKDGYEPDGAVTIDELGKYLEKELPAQARAVGKTPKEKEAVPYLGGASASRFVVTSNPDQAEAVQKRLKAVAKVAADGKLTKEAATEGATLLARMPRLKAMQELRKKYQALADGTITPAELTTAADEIKKGMVLSTDDGEMFAKKVMTAVAFTDALFVKPTVRGEVVVGAVKGMFEALEEALPDEFTEKAKGAATWKKADMEDYLSAARVKLGKREDLDGHKDADLAISVLVHNLGDKFTTYIDKETVKRANSELSGRFSGVGIQIRRDLVNDAILVATPIKGSPAYKAGIQTGDLIVGIKRTVDPDGKDLKDDEPKEFSTKGMSTTQAVAIILGKPGVPITLTIRTPDGKEKNVELKRGSVASETVLGLKRTEDDGWDYWLDPKAKIAYIRLTQFTYDQTGGPDSIKELTAVLRQLTKDDVKGLVFDLRFNPGGALDAAGAICSMFVSDGKVVTVKSRIKAPDVYKTDYYRQRHKLDPALTDLPVAVLINGESASASEIVSACLQDHDRAVVVGERSYGKGSVQTLRDFPATEGLMKMTFARYFPPSDRNIDRFSTPGKPEDEWGVKPSSGYEVKNSREEKTDLFDVIHDREIIPRKDKLGEKKKEKEGFKDAQLEKAMEYLKEQMKAKK